MPAGAASYRIAGTLNASVMMGEKLCESPLMQNYFAYVYNAYLYVASDPDLQQATLQFAHDAAITTQLMRLTPAILQR